MSSGWAILEVNCPSTTITGACGFEIAMIVPAPVLK